MRFCPQTFRSGNGIKWQFSKILTIWFCSFMMTSPTNIFFITYWLNFTFHIHLHLFGRWFHLWNIFNCVFIVFHFLKLFRFSVIFYFFIFYLFLCFFFFFKKIFFLFFFSYKTFAYIWFLLGFYFDGSFLIYICF